MAKNLTEATNSGSSIKGGDTLVKLYLDFSFFTAFIG